MAKKQLTATQKKNKYRALQYSTFVGEFVSILTPFIVMGIVNADEWFTTEQGWKVGLGGTLALALMGIAVLLVTKKKENNEITSGYVTLIVGWFAVAFVFVLLASIIEQIATIMLFGGLGLLGAFGLDLTSKHFKGKADLYKTAIQNVRGKQAEQDALKQIEQEAKKELEELERKAKESMKIF